MSVSRSFHYSAGSAQEFKEEGFTLRPADFEDELTYDPENEHTSFPVVILMETDTPQGKQASHILYLALEGVNDSLGDKYNLLHLFCSLSLSFSLPVAPESQQQAHLSICNLDRANGNGYSIKTFKQKLVVSP